MAHDPSEELPDQARLVDPGQEQGRHPGGAHSDQRVLDRSLPLLACNGTDSTTDQMGYCTHYESPFSRRSG